MTAIARLRLAAYVRSYVALAPTLAGLIVLALLYGGGRARPEEAYGVTGVVLFPVIAWQVKILLDAEPDVQRRLVRVAVGSAEREIGAGLLAGALAAVPTVALGLAVPWIVDGVTLTGSVGLVPALALGLWVQAGSALTAVVLGAWSSRAVTRTAGISVCVLAGGSVVAIVLGLGPLRWLAPPLVPAARALTAGTSVGPVLGFSIWYVAWAAVLGAGYLAVRRNRS